jgi:hypothetical protein
MKKHFFVISTHGIITASSQDGTIVKVEPETDPESIEFLNSIASFDIREWQSQYPNEQLTGQTIDILDIGYTNKGGTYEPPETDWRQEYATKSQG